MKRPKFVRVVKDPRPRAGTNTEGFRREGDVLPIGAIVPVEWFKDTPDSVFAFLINPVEAGGIGVIEEVTPDVKQMALLRDQYPAAFADNPTPSPSPKHQGEELAPDKADSPKTRATKKQEDGE